MASAFNIEEYIDPSEFEAINFAIEQSRKDLSSVNQIKKIKDFQEEINKEWEGLKLFLRKLIEVNKISYSVFVNLVKHEHDEFKTAYISSYMLYTLRDLSDNTISLNKSKMANKLFILLENFKNRYENDIDYKNNFDERLSNVDVELICKTKIDDIFEVFQEIGFSRIKLIEYSPDILKFDVVVNISVFDINKYEYDGISFIPFKQNNKKMILPSNPNIIENNKLILKKIITENLKKYEIINDNVHIDINDICVSQYL